MEQLPTVFTAAMWVRGFRSRWTKRLGSFCIWRKTFFLRLTRIIAQYFTQAGANQLTAPPRAPMVWLFTGQNTCTMYIGVILLCTLFRHQRTVNGSVSIFVLILCSDSGHMTFTLTTHRSCTGAHNNCWLSNGGEDWNNENGDWDNNRVDCCTTSFGNGMALGTHNLLK